MRILFVRPPQPKLTHGLKHLMVCEPLELEYVAAGVPDHDIRIHDMLVDKGLKKLKTVLQNFKPDIVGTTCYINNTLEALDVCQITKEINPGITTVVGGVHAVFNEDDFEKAYVDFIVKGEGITTFQELVTSLENGSALENIKGIGYPLNGRFTYTEMRPFPPDVNQFPLPNRKLTERYRNDYFYLQWRPLTLMRTSWGCPYKCSFCYNRHLTDDKYFTRTPESVVDELETIDSNEVFIIDDTFLFDKKWLEKTYNLIKERNIKKEYLAYGRTDFIARNKDIIKKWEEIGLRIIRVGLEAVTDEELKRYNKKNTVANNDKAIEICKELNIDISASLLLPPHYSKDDFKNLSAYLKKNELVYIFLNPLQPLPGSLIYDDYKDKLIVPYKEGYALWDFQHCVIKPEKMSLKSFYRQMNLLYFKNANPLRVRKLSRRRVPNFFSLGGFKLLKDLGIAYLEMLFVVRQHKSLEKRIGKKC